MNQYKTSGVCSQYINFEVDDKGMITFVQFIGGCPGNAQGVAKLSIGRHIDDVINTLDGIKCRPTTSCPDQFAKALKIYKEQNHIK